MKKFNFKAARFVTTFVALPLKGIRPGTPSFCFVGRSNVGKSSLINHLTANPRLAKVSQVPGKTQAINLFEIDQSIYFYDLPGYGFSQTGKTLRESWGALLGKFLLDYRPHVFVLTDSRHPLFDSDHQMISWLEENNISFTLVATKADKLNSSEKHRKTQEIRNTFSTNPLFYSVHSFEGKQAIQLVMQTLSQSPNTQIETPQMALA
ncbi:MAG: ribosome biogenesis GTP-binding protein YihA/YsxC [Chlamydiia bacterium]